jgi:hypothetical protein
MHRFRQVDTETTNQSDNPQIQVWFSGLRVGYRNDPTISRRHSLPSSAHWWLGALTLYAPIMAHFHPPVTKKFVPEIARCVFDRLSELIKWASRIRTNLRHQLKARLPFG